MKSNTLIVTAIMVHLLGGCDYRNTREAYDRQLEVCSVAENNGLLDTAVQACGAALAISEEHRYASDSVSGLLYRLGRLERQRGRFEEAERLTRRSLAIEEQSGNQAAVAARLVELALTAAGQERWQDGAQLLERAAPLVNHLSGDERQAAAKVFRGFSARLGLRGETAQAARLKARAEELAGS